MLLIESRRRREPARRRCGATRHQDRDLWNRASIAEGTVDCARAARTSAGSVSDSAAISAVHSVARSASATDWHQIVGWRRLLAITPSRRLIVRAVAVAETRAGGGAQFSMGSWITTIVPRHSRTSSSASIAPRTRRRHTTPRSLLQATTAAPFPRAREALVECADRFFLLRCQMGV